MRFVQDTGWMNIVSILAGHNFLQLEKVLDQNVNDAFAFLQYLDMKGNAEVAQEKFINERNKRKRR